MEIWSKYYMACCFETPTSRGNGDFLTLWIACSTKGCMPSDSFGLSFTRQWP